MTLKEEIKSILNSRPSKKLPLNNAVEEKHDVNYRNKVRFFPKKKGYMIALIGMSLIAIFFMLSLLVVDAFPADLTITMVLAMLTLLIVTSVLFASNKKKKRIIGIIIGVLFSLSFTFATAFLGNTYAMLANISDSGVQQTGLSAKTVDVTEEPFNVYITGIDQWASEKGQDLERSDVNMLVTINPKTKKILLTSIPRDTYVELFTAGQMDKLTHTGIYGVEETLNTVEKWLNVDINYYVKMNFTGMCAIVDALDGIDVYSPVDFQSSIKGYEYKKGMNHLYGRKALYFARERKSFEGQDSVRVENQQRVVKAIIKKMTSSTTILTRYGDVMDAAGENLTTNMSTDELKSLVKMQITELSNWDVETQKIEGVYDQDYVASLTQSQKFDIYRPDEGSVKIVRENIDSVMNPTKDEIDEANKNRTKSFFVNAVKNNFNRKKSKEQQ